MNQSDPSSRAAAQVIETSDPTRLPIEPLVSVYMLAYRHERFIAEAIEGVVSQQCDFSFELIIGEDCSPDRTRQIAIDYQKRYPHIIRILTSERNVGAYANARRCQLATRGRFVAICEGDDYWHNPRKLQMQADLLSSDTNIVFCHTDFDRKTRFRTWHSKHRNHPTPWLAQGNAYLALLHEWSVMTATIMFRREIMLSFMGTEFDNPLWPFGDRNKILHASLYGQVGYIDESTATYRKVRNSALNTGASSSLRMPLAAEECVEMFLNKYPVDNINELRIRARLKTNIYKSAFFAERADLMDLAFEWLQSNGFKPSLLRHKTLIIAVKLAFPVKALRVIKDFIDLHLSSINS